MSASTTPHNYVDGFAHYPVLTNETPFLYIVFVCLLVTFAVSVVGPIACWGHARARRRKVGEDSSTCTNSPHHQKNHDSTSMVQQPHPTTSNNSTSTATSVVDTHFSPNTTARASSTVDGGSMGLSSHHKQQQQHNQTIRRQQLQRPEQYMESHNVSDLRIFHSELLAAMKVVATERRFGTTTHPNGSTQQFSHSDPTTQQYRFRLDRSGSFTNKSCYKNNTERASNIPSVATTSRIHSTRKMNGGERKGLFRSRMPWSHNRPLPRPDMMQRSVWKEREIWHHTTTGLSEDGNGSRSHVSRFSYSADPTGQQQSHVLPLTKSRVTSGAAGSFLENEAIDGEAEFYRKRYLEKQQKANQQQRRRTGSASVSGNSISEVGSIMPPLSSSVLAPQDAADANDPGRIPSQMKYKTTTISSTGEYLHQNEDLSDFLSSIYIHLLDLAEHNYESQRILSLAVLPTISAIAEPLFRVALVAIISHFIDTNSMVAYVLVILFIRITTMEISGAVADAESNMLQDAFLYGGNLRFYHAGQTMQIAILFQILIGLPVLLIWFFVMDDVVLWLVDDSRIAELASEYTGIIIIDYLIRSASRSFMLPFHLLGHSQFEKYIDLTATALTGIAIAIVATTNDLSLFAIGWIQVIIGMAKAATKIAFVVFKGWLVPYQDGLFKSWAMKTTGAVVSFLSQVFPLFLGSLLEVGEWEVLIFFVSYLGGAEVAAWGVMGILWEIFQAMTEGLGEAASVRVSYYLSEGLYHEARHLAHKVVFISIVFVVMVTGIFLMAAPNIAATISTDSTIQHIFVDLVGPTGLANISMTIAQIYWSLAGAQGRFGLASATILLCRWMVILPIASICIFAYRLDLMSAACAIAIGYSIAACTLAYAVFASDWEQLSYFLRDDDVAGGEVGAAVDYYNDNGAGVVAEVDDEDDSSFDDDEDESDDESMFEEGENESESRPDEESNIL